MLKTRVLVSKLRASDWSKNSVIQTPIFPNTMSRDRYLHILRFLHFTYNDNAPDPADPNRDKLWKIKPFLNPLLPRFTTVYAPSQNLPLDETLINCKGQDQFRQFLPLKRSRFGLKGFVIADASTGYVLNTSIYTGKEGPACCSEPNRAICPVKDTGYLLTTSIQCTPLSGTGKKEYTCLWHCEGE